MGQPRPPAEPAPISHQSGTMVGMATADDHAARVAADGYAIIEDAIAPDLLAGLQSELDRLEDELQVRPADNDFEGRHTLRVYNLLARGEIWAKVPVHPAVLPVVEGVLDRGCLVSSLSSISIGPGETAQPIHADDQLMPLAKPHAPTVCNTMWALTDFTAANGATRIIPGSHLADTSPDYGAPYDSIPAEMPAGSVLVWHGSLWHGGGANTTGERRVGVAMNYCAGYIRQQENQQLGIPPGLAATFEPRLLELIGYGLYHGLIGHIDKRSPAEVFLHGASAGMVWDVVERRTP